MYLYTVLRSDEEARPVKRDVLGGLVSELRGCLEREFEGYGGIYEDFAEDGVINPHYGKYYSSNVLLYVSLFLNLHLLHFKRH